MQTETEALPEANEEGPLPTIPISDNLRMDTEHGTKPYSRSRVSLLVGHPNR